MFGNDCHTVKSSSLVPSLGSSSGDRCPGYFIRDPSYSLSKRSQQLKILKQTTVYMKGAKEERLALGPHFCSKRLV